MDSKKHSEKNIDPDEIQKKLLRKEIHKDTTRIHEYYKSGNVALKKIVLLVMLVILAAIALFAALNSFFFLDEPGELTSGYIIYNLKGDTVDTWLTWQVTEDELFHVHVRDSPLVTDEIANEIVDIIMSKETFLLNDKLLNKGSGESLFYVGWAGALEQIPDGVKFPSPKNLHFHITDNEDGRIMINLVNTSHPDKYSGFTKLISDPTHNQILKAEITIYDLDKISKAQFRTILRHELGHAFGLAHSTDPEDLMHPVIKTNYPFISDCDLDALTALYDGSEKSKVICEK